MPLLPPRRKHPVLRWARWMLFMFGIASLGFVAYSFVDAKMFQVYEDWRLDRALKNFHPPHTPPLTAAVPASLRPGDVHVTPVALGSAIGRIEISRIGVDAIVVEGTNGRALRRAVGHIAGTPLPGGSGNVAIAGHRDTFFRPLRNVQMNDEILLTTPGGLYRYRVDSMQIVAADDAEALSDSGEATLTLVTCYPFYFVGPAPKRFIVHAHRDSGRPASSAAADGDAARRLAPLLPEGTHP